MGLLRNMVMSLAQTTGQGEERAGGGAGRGGAGRGWSGQGLMETGVAFPWT